MWESKKETLSSTSVLGSYTPLVALEGLVGLTGGRNSVKWLGLAQLGNNMTGRGGLLSGFKWLSYEGLPDRGSLLLRSCGNSA